MVNPDNTALSRAQPGVDLRWPASAIWRPGEPMVHSIGLADLRDAVAKGIEDFKAVPSHAVFLCIIYPVIGLILGRLRLDTICCRSYSRSSPGLPWSVHLQPWAYMS